MSIRQPLTLVDYRHESKGNSSLAILQSIARLTDRVVVYADAQDRDMLVQQNTLQPYLDIRDYSELQAWIDEDDQEQRDACTKSHCCKRNVAVDVERDPNEPPVVLFSQPTYLLTKIVRALSKRGTGRVYLLYRTDEQSLHERDLHYPNRYVMVIAYKALMPLLQNKQTVSRAKLLAEQANVFSIEILQIMQELGFITVAGDAIALGEIHQRDLHDSPLFARLEQELCTIKQMEEENLRLSQYDILRG